MAREPLGRNENGYVIHPDRNSGKELDRRFGWSFLGAGIGAFIINPAVGWPVAVWFGFLGVYYLRKSSD